MIWSQTALIDDQIVLEQWFRLLEASLVLIQKPPSVPDEGGLQIVCPQVLLVDVQGSTGQGFSLVVEPSRLIEGRQPMQAGCGLQMIWPQLLLAHGQRPLKQRLRLGVVAIGPLQDRQMMQAAGHLRMLGYPLPLAHGQRSSVQGFRLAVHAVLQEIAAGAVKQIGRFGQREILLLDQRVAGLYLFQVALTLWPGLCTARLLGKDAIEGEHETVDPLMQFLWLYRV